MVYDDIINGIKGLSNRPNEWFPILVGGTAAEGATRLHDRKLLEYFLGWQYIAITTIAEVVAGIKIVVKKKKTQEIVTEGKVNEAFDKINSLGDF